jgi:hypothetical protein
MAEGTRSMRRSNGERTRGEGEGEGEGVTAKGRKEHEKVEGEGVARMTGRQANGLQLH